MKQLIFWAILAIVLVAGCTTGNNSAQVQSFVQTLPQVRGFLEENPNANIRVVLMDIETVQANMPSIKEACGIELPIKQYYFVTVEESQDKVLIWLNENNEVQCLAREGSKEPVNETDEIERTTEAIEDQESESEIEQEITEEEIENESTEITQAPIGEEETSTSIQTRPASDLNQPTQAQMQTCTSQRGYICTSNQTCTSNWLNASDTTACCRTECTLVNGAIVSTSSTSSGTTTDVNTGILPSSSTIVLTISDITVSQLTSNSATITWTTNEASNSEVRYSTASETAVHSATPITVTDYNLSHTIRLSNLNPNTKYYYKVTSTNQAGSRSAASNVSYFTTQALPTPTISNIQATGITSTTAIINWKTDLLTKGTVNYGTTSSLGSNASQPYYYSDNNVQLTGLTSNTTYYYTITVTDQNNSTTQSTQYSFNTLGQPPVISNIQANPSDFTNVRIYGTYIDWQTDVGGVTGEVRLNTNQSQLGTGNDIVIPQTDPWQLHKVPLNGLSPSTTYYYTISATNSNGTTTTPVSSFTTLAPITISNVTATPGILNGIPIATFSWTSSMTASTGVRSTSDPNLLPINYEPTGGADSSYSTLHYLTTGYTAGKTYYYKVYSTNGSAYGESSIASFTMPG